MWRRGRSFRDRRDAGRRLAAALQHYRDADAVVLALPRGGVPVGFEVAVALGAPLDILLVRKIGAPGQEELALGALVDGADPQVVLNDDVLELVHPPPDYIAGEIERQRREIERRRHLYRGTAEPVALAGRTAIVVDDGIATGATVAAALKGVARTRPRRLVLAVPVAPSDTRDRLAAACDDVVCLETPEPFRSVGSHYDDFAQTSDEEVVRLLAEARQRLRAEKSRAPAGQGTSPRAGG